MIYVLSDIHGREDRFDNILNQIDFNDADHLYILGDIIDRTPYGVHLLRRISRAHNMTMLLGNHEYMMLDAIDHPDDKHKQSLWQNSNAGYITWEKWKFCTHAFREEMLAFLRDLPINIELSYAGKEWLLVHGSPEIMYGPRDYYDYRDSRKFAVWHRLSESDVIPGNRTVIFGHTPTCYYTGSNPMSIYYGKQRIGIDCGCAYKEGRLACFRLDDGKEFYSIDSKC